VKRALALPPRSRALAFAFAALASGCGPTSLLLLVQNDPSAPAPSSLDVAAFGARRLKLAGDPLPLSGAALPLTIGLDALDPVPPNFRVLVSGLDAGGAIASQAAGRVPLSAGVENHATITLRAGRLPDCNGDGVPDAIQLCPGFNPDDDCSSASGAPTCADGGGLDLAPPDGSETLRRCPAASLFCEDFENWTSTMSSWIGHTISPPSAWSVDAMASAPPAGGAFSAHVTTTFQAATVKSEADYRHVLPQTTAGVLTARMYLYLPAAVGDGDYYLWLLNSKGGEGVLLGTVVNGGHLSWHVLTDGGLEQVSTDTPPIGRWACVELDVDQEPTGTVKLYVDDALVMTVGGDTRVSNTSGDATQQGIDRLAIGYVTAVNVTEQAWIDDVAAGTAHLGCE